MTYHSFAKPVAFFSAGTLAQLHSSSNFDRIGTGTLSRAPIASALLLLAALIDHRARRRSACSSAR